MEAGHEASASDFGRYSTFANAPKVEPTGASTTVEAKKVVVHIEPGSVELEPAPEVESVPAAAPSAAPDAAA